MKIGSDTDIHQISKSCDGRQRDAVFSSLARNE